MGVQNGHPPAQLIFEPGALLPFAQDDVRERAALLAERVGAEEMAEAAQAVLEKEAEAGDCAPSGLGC